MVEDSECPEEHLNSMASEAEFTARLRSLVARPLSVRFTRNKGSVLCVKESPGKGLEVRLQHAFRASDDRTLLALASFIMGGNQDSRVLVHAFLKANQYLFQLLARDGSPRTVKPRGRHHDLLLLLERVGGIHRLEVDGIHIGWAARKRPSSRRTSIRFGSWSAGHGIIRVHPALDTALVPAFFVEYVIYHEVLHSVFPAEERTGSSRRIHTPTFKRMEKRFYRYDEAVAYEQSFVRSFLK